MNAEGCQNAEMAAGIRMARRPFLGSISSAFAAALGSRIIKFPKKQAEASGGEVLEVTEGLKMDIQLEQPIVHAKIIGNLDFRTAIRSHSLANVNFLSRRVKVEPSPGRNFNPSPHFAGELDHFMEHVHKSRRRDAGRLLDAHMSGF